MEKIQEQQTARVYEVRYRCDPRKETRERERVIIIKRVCVNTGTPFQSPVTGRLEILHVDLIRLIESSEALEFEDGEIRTVSRILQRVRDGQKTRRPLEGVLREETLVRFARSFQEIFRTNRIVDYWIENFAELRPYLD